MTNNEYNRQLQKEKGKRITYIIVGVIGVALFFIHPCYRSHPHHISDFSIFT